MPEADLVLRHPTLSDGAQVHHLIAASPPLDLNSAYAYYLLCSHFASTCVVAELDGRLVGFLSAYRQPDHGERLFVWQMAVAGELRGRGLASRMVAWLLECPASAGVTHLDVTVSPSNDASRRVFARLAERHAAPLTECLWLDRERFSDGHEEELLLSVGPLRQPRI